MGGASPFDAARYSDASAPTSPELAAAITIPGSTARVIGDGVTGPEGVLDAPSALD